MQRFLVRIEDTEDVDGVSSFIDGKGDEVRESLHGLAADVPVADSGGGGIMLQIKSFCVINNRVIGKRLI